MALFDDIAFLAGGGALQAELELGSFQATEQARAQRADVANEFLRTLFDVQRDPFSIVPAMQLFAAAGGGTLAPAASLAQHGARPADFGSIVNDVIASLTGFAAGDEAGTRAERQARRSRRAAAGTQAAAEQAAGTIASTAPPATDGDRGIPLQGEVPGSPTDTAAAPARPNVIDRAKLPPSVQAAITQFEAGLGSLSDIASAVRGAGSERFVNPVTGGAVEPTASRQGTPFQPIPDAINTHELKSSLQSLIARRPARNANRNQFNALRVGRAAA